MRLQGKVVLITGAARRVGRAVAVAVAAKGARLAIHYNRSRREAERLAAELRDGFGRDADVFKADLENVAQVRRLPDAVAKRFGALHVLINNASAYESSDFESTTPADWDMHMDVNLKAPFFLCQSAAPHLRRAGGGKIINMADWSGQRPYVDYIPYCVSKAGLLCLNTALAKQLAPDIQVNAIMPGPVLLPESYTRRGREAVAKATLLKRLGSPNDIAEAVIFLIENGDFITGAALPVDGGRLIA